jgi:hypothetical protein
VSYEILPGPGSYETDNTSIQKRLKTPNQDLKVNKKSKGRSRNNQNMYMKNTVMAYTAGFMHPKLKHLERPNPKGTYGTNAFQESEKLK